MSESVSFFDFSRRRYRLPPARIGLLRFFVEGYDGLLFLRTVEARTAVIELSWPQSCAVDVEEILSALAAELGMVAIEEE